MNCPLSLLIPLPNEEKLVPPLVDRVEVITGKWSDLQLRIILVDMTGAAITACCTGGGIDTRKVNFRFRYPVRLPGNNWNRRFDADRSHSTALHYSHYFYLKMPGRINIGRIINAAIISNQQVSWNHYTPAHADQHELPLLIVVQLSPHRLIYLHAIRPPPGCFALFGSTAPTRLKITFVSLPIVQRCRSCQLCPGSSAICWSVHYYLRGWRCPVPAGATRCASEGASIISHPLRNGGKWRE